MRPLPVERIAGVPSFVLGLAVVRGAATLVLDAASLISGAPSHATRFVTVKIGSRRVALAVDTVVGIVEVPPGSFNALPALLRDDRLEAISAIGSLDSKLMLVLRSARLVPEDLWATIETGGVTA
jgi:purine-binding chemotaxis protein CheW